MKKSRYIGKYVHGGGELNGVDGVGEKFVIDHEDIFPITEMSGIEWGYTGPDQFEPDEGGKFYAAGGHFMGLACGSAETNIRSCVNLKRACEIGTTFSERLEVPIGFRENPDDEDFDVVNYLFVSPSGLISKDQVVDVTFRSIFATLNQNSLRTVIDPVTKHKKYDFCYLIPDSFDGSLSEKVKDNSKYHKRIPLEWDSYWENMTDNDKKKYAEFWDDIILEQGYTTHRDTETKSNDYIRFRHGDERVFLYNSLMPTNNGGKARSMPVYKNSFYFYFGLKEGLTALDEFKTQFLGACAKSTIIGKEGRVDYKTTKHNTGFVYDIEVLTNNMTPPLKYELVEDNELKIGSSNSDNFTIKNISMGEHTLTVTDSLGNITVKNIEIGIGYYSVNYSTSSIVHYENKEERTTIESFAQKGNGGYIIGDFSVTEIKPNTYGTTYKASIKLIDSRIPEIFVNDSAWQQLYETTTNKFWCVGYGTYEVRINEYYNGSITDSYVYGHFTVNNGIEPPTVYLGSYEYKSSYNVSTIDAAKRLDYGVYRTIVNTSDGPFALLFNCEGENKSLFNSIFAGKPENGKEVGEEVILSSKVTSPWVLEQNNITLPSNYDNRGPFYYTAYNDNGVFATEYGKSTVINNKITLNINENGYYCLISNGEQILHNFTETGNAIEFIYEDFLEFKSIITCLFLVSLSSCP
jgi:hypothetical protein